MPAFSLCPRFLPNFSAALRWFGLVLLSLTILPPLPAQTQKSSRVWPHKFKKTSSLKQRTGAEGGNLMYEVVVEDTVGNGVGLFTIRTGETHPVTRLLNNQKQDLLGGANGELGSSYITVRSYTSASGTDYVQSDFIEAAPPFKTIWLDALLARANQFSPVKPTKNNTGDTTGFETTYDLPGLPQTPDKMRITTRTEVHGTNFDDSWVEITTIVENTGNQMLRIGIRYLLDLKIGEDDGAEVIESAHGTGFGKTEKEFKRPNFAYFRAATNDTIRDLPPRRYHVYGSVITPPNLLRVPDQPTLLQHVSWPLAFLRPFTYDIHSDSNFVITRDARNTDPASRTGGDNAILYFWGETQDKAITIEPGKKVQVTQGILATPPDVLPPLYDRVPPLCTFAFSGSNAITGFFSDAGDGIAEINPLWLYNAKLVVDSLFKPGDAKVNFRLENLDQDSYIGFNVKITDLCGNAHVCDPVMSYLSTTHDNSRYTFKFQRVDRYLTLANRGLSEIRVDLNGHRFDLYSSSNPGVRLMNSYRIPQEGNFTIDMQPYLRDGENMMQLEIAGGPGANADLTLIDEAHEIDHTLALAPMPEKFALSQNLPNPFSRNGGTTEIRFEVPESGNSLGRANRVELKIYNMLGQLVRTLVDAELQAGAYTANWDGRDANGRQVAAGVYFYNLNANGIRITKKMALIR